MRTNIKRIDTAFKEFCESHALINEYKSFGYDGESDNNNYPMLWCGMDDVVISRKRGSLNPIIPCLMFVGREIGDKGTMVSEAVDLSDDLIKHFSENEDIYGFTCSDDTSFRVADNQTDLSIAVIFELTLTIRNSENRCEIPLE